MVDDEDGALNDLAHRRHEAGRNRYHFDWESPPTLWERAGIVALNTPTEGTVCGRLKRQVDDLLKRHRFECCSTS